MRLGLLRAAGPTGPRPAGAAGPMAGRLPLLALARALRAVVSGAAAAAGRRCGVLRGCSAWCSGRCPGGGKLETRDNNGCKNKRRARLGLGRGGPTRTRGREPAASRSSRAPCNCAISYHDAAGEGGHALPRPATPVHALGRSREGEIRAL